LEKGSAKNLWTLGKTTSKLKASWTCITTRLEEGSVVIRLRSMLSDMIIVRCIWNFGGGGGFRV
jgi:hypothetical protein